MSASNSRQSGTSRNHSSKLHALPVLFRQAFALKNNPYPYWKAFRAGLASSLPVLIGLLFGRVNEGLLASLGGFTYLYVFHQPYAERARRIFFVMLGIALCVALGTLLAPYPLVSAFAMGAVVAIPIYIFGSLRIAGPSAIFFVLTYAMATGMPVDPSLAPLRGGLALLGGTLSWVLCMLDWFADPRGPETKAIKKVYAELAELVGSMGSEAFLAARHRTVRALKEAEDTLMAGYSPFTASDSFKRLYMLNEQANEFFLHALEFSEERRTPPPPVIKETLLILAGAIGKKNPPDPKPLLSERANGPIEVLLRDLREADRILRDSADRIKRKIVFSRPSLKTIFLGAFDKNSIVLLTAVRSGLVVIAAAIVAISFPFERSYWIPLSCASVMAGSNFIGTFHRSVQRTVGTIVGLLIAGLILSTVYSDYLIVLIILMLTFLTETFIVRNYGIAAMFFTPAALVMAEYSTKRFDFGYFASARLVDILIGSFIGLLGTVLIGRKLATSLLQHFIAKSIRSMGRYLLLLFSPRYERAAMNGNIERSKVQTNLINLQSVYGTALGELHGSKERLEAMWPVLFSVEQLGYYLNACSKSEKRPELPEDDLSRLLYIFETMAMAIDHDQPLTVKSVPRIEGFAKIGNEIADLQQALQLRLGKP